MATTFLVTPGLPCWCCVGGGRLSSNSRLKGGEVISTHVHLYKYAAGSTVEYGTDVSSLILFVPCMISRWDC